MIKSIKISSKYLNKNKFNQIKYFDEYILDIKNLMSQDIHNSLKSLSTLSKNEFNKKYIHYKTEFFTPWEIQNIFQMIVGLYYNSIKKKQQNQQIKLQKSIRISHYRKKTKCHNVGDLKDFQINYKSTNLTKLIKYMIYIDLEQHNEIMTNSKLSEIYNYYKSKPYFDRIITLTQSIQTRILKSIKKIEFSTGTHHKSFCESGNKTYLCSQLIKDETNSKFKYWFKYKNKIKDMFIPVQINQQYHYDIDKLIDEQKQFLVKVDKHKVHIITTKESSDPIFKDKINVVGLDLNVKNNFAYSSNNKSYDYDRTHVQKVINAFETKDIKKIEKSVKQNEFYFKKLISSILDDLENNNVTDIVMEDLDSFGATYIRSKEFNIKYSKLVRLLRLSNIKHWFNQQAEKRGIRIHLTTARYSSQQCPVCGCIDRNNRKTQELFSCIDCGYTTNADYNSSINLERRFTEDVLQSKLHDFDEFNRLIPKKLNKLQIRNILTEFYQVS